MAKNLYETLGISKSASEAEIKSAYRNLAKKYHPDLYANKSESEKQNAEQKFKEVKDAYDVLSDSSRRAQYDRFGTTDTSAGGGAGGWAGGGGWSASAEGFEDIFNDIFGGGRSRGNTQSSGSDITLSMTITFEEAIFGAEKQIIVTRNETCPTCKGSGGKDEASVRACKGCNGTGSVTLTQSTIFGQTRVQRPCPDCKGKGKIIVDKCRSCKGSGIVSREREVNVKIPAGVDDNQIMNYKGEGNVGTNGGAPGNLIIIISVKEDKLYKREEKDLHIELPVSMHDAIMGAKLKVPTLSNEDVRINIPAGTQTGDVVKVKGKGVKDIRSNNFGDLYVTIKVDTPKNLNRKQADLLKKFTETLSENQSENKFTFERNYMGKGKK